jgi:hypothetical protein
VSCVAGVPQIVRGWGVHCPRFFHDAKHYDANYPPPLFECLEEQATFVTRQGISRQRCFDGVRRSSTTCGYDTHIVEDKKLCDTKKIAGPGPRLQLKPCKVVSHTYQPCAIIFLAVTVACALRLTNYVHCK